MLTYSHARLRFPFVRTQDEAGDCFAQKFDIQKVVSDTLIDCFVTLSGSYGIDPKILAPLLVPGADAPPRLGAEYDCDQLLRRSTQLLEEADARPIHVALFLQRKCCVTHASSHNIMLRLRCQEMMARYRLCCESDDLVMNDERLRGANDCNLMCTLANALQVASEQFTADQVLPVQLCYAVDAGWAFVVALGETLETALINENLNARGRFAEHPELH